MLSFSKRSYYNDDVFTGKAEIYNYSPSALKNAKFKWWVTDADGKVLKSGKWSHYSYSDNIDITLINMISSIFTSQEDKQ